jgi:hypothetical protein
MGPILVVSEPSPFWHTLKHTYVVTYIKQSPVLKGHLFLFLSYKKSYELNLFQEVICLIRPCFLCPKCDLLIQVWLYTNLYFILSTQQFSISIPLFTTMSTLKIKLLPHAEIKCYNKRLWLQIKEGHIHLINTPLKVGS